MYSAASQLLDNFKSSKEYRHAFAEEKVRTQLAVQIKAMREQRQMGRAEFAALMHKAHSWVFRLEDPNQPPPTISTLLKVAEAFDVDLDIRFRRFSALLDQIERMTPTSFDVPSFDEELKEGAFDRNISAALENPMALCNALTQEQVPINDLLGKQEPPPPYPIASAVSNPEQVGCTANFYIREGTQTEKASGEVVRITKLRRRKRVEKLGMWSRRTA
jgi:transcriptional regulator with XRE-family HTH domain